MSGIYPHSIVDITTNHIQANINQSLAQSQQAMNNLQSIQNQYSNAQQNYLAQAAASQANIILEGNLMSAQPRRNGKLYIEENVKKAIYKPTFDLRRFLDRLIHLPIAFIDILAVLA